MECADNYDLLRFKVINSCTNSIDLVRLYMWFIQQKRKIAQNFLVQRPGYTKRPFGHRVAYPT